MSFFRAITSPAHVASLKFEFPAPIAQYSYFKKSTVILVRLADHTIWQSSNEGYHWIQLHPEEKFVAFYHHTFSHDRAYLITDSNRFWYTTDIGKTWHKLDAPLPPNIFGLQILHFHPLKTEYLIWSGSKDCEGYGEKCHVEAYYTQNNGRTWNFIEKYVRNCAWARDAELHADSSQILCESYKDKDGNQRVFQMRNPLELVGGTNFFEKRSKLFDHIVGFAKFSEYLIVAEVGLSHHTSVWVSLISGNVMQYQAEKQSLDLQVSLDGRTFAVGMFPPSMRLEQHVSTQKRALTGYIDKRGLKRRILFLNPRQCPSSSTSRPQSLPIHSGVIYSNQTLMEHTSGYLWTTSIVTTLDTLISKN